MSDILDRFIKAAKENVSSGYYEYAGACMERISLAEKLKNNDFSLISEIKHASPAGEYSFEHIDVHGTARVFANCGSDAISCVVEPQIFKGNLGNIPLAKQAGLPVLFKDFVFDEVQVRAALSSGADVVLLIVKMLERLDIDVSSMVDLVHSYGLEVLLECYDASEMKTALDTSADILGINNRDLRTLSVDIGSTKRILDDVGEIDRPLISESGIKTSADASFVRDAGAKGVLVGTALWKADDMQAKIRELRL
jgi:indole-3-glycerol phosphate synthase